MLATSESVLSVAKGHPEHEQLVLLSAISILWLEPQNPAAGELIKRYRKLSLAFEALRETALQLFLIAGFQASLEAAFQIEAIYGHGLIDDHFAPEGTDPAELYTRGQELQAEVYRGNFEKLRQNLDRVSPQLSQWTVIVGYGLVMSRPGLPRHFRELLEAAVLAAQGFSRQLHSHLRGSLNMGASAAEVDVVLEVVGRLASEERHSRAVRMWHMVRHNYCQNGAIS